MQSQALLSADYLDILFDNRNKAYGGYELRKNYYRRVKRPLTFLLFSACLSVIYPAVAGYLHRSDAPLLASKELPVNVLNDLQPDLPKPPVEVTIPEPAAALATEKMTPPVIEPDAAVTEADVLPTAKDLEKVQIGTERREGELTDGTLNAPNTSASKNGKEIVETVEAPPAIVDWVEQMPEFDGNLQDFLSRSIRYPEAAREANVQGRVIVQFVVNEDGRVSNATVLRGIGGGCDEEAARVVNKMPKWKPGKQNGKAVKVYYRLPVVFQLD